MFKNLLSNGLLISFAKSARVVEYTDCRWVKRVSWYDAKQFDGEATVALKL